MTGRMISKYRGECSACGGSWDVGAMIFFVEGDWKHWYCSESCARSVSVPVDAQTPQTVTYSTPQANIAVNAKESPPKGYYDAYKEGLVDRNRAIAHAHDENMAANERLVESLDGVSVNISGMEDAYLRLVQAIDLQTAVCDDLRAELAKIAKCMQDDYLARRGVQV